MLKREAEEAAAGRPKSSRGSAGFSGGGPSEDQATRMGFSRGFSRKGCRIFVPSTCFAREGWVSKESMVRQRPHSFFPPTKNTGLDVGKGTRRQILSRKGGRIQDVFRAPVPLLGGEYIILWPESPASIRDHSDGAPG